VYYVFVLMEIGTRKIVHFISWPQPSVQSCERVCCLLQPS
jgi:hypothetical protein